MAACTVPTSQMRGLNLSYPLGGNPFLKSKIPGQLESEEGCPTLYWSNSLDLIYPNKKPQKVLAVPRSSTLDYMNFCLSIIKSHVFESLGASNLLIATIGFVFRKGEKGSNRTYKTEFVIKEGAICVFVSGGKSLVSPLVLKSINRVVAGVINPTYRVMFSPSPYQHTEEQLCPAILSQIESAFKRNIIPEGKKVYAVVVDICSRYDVCNYKQCRTLLRGLMSKLEKQLADQFDSKFFSSRRTGPRCVVRVLSERFCEEDKHQLMPKRPVEMPDAPPLNIKQISEARVILASRDCHDHLKKDGAKYKSWDRYERATCAFNLLRNEKIRELLSDQSGLSKEVRLFLREWSMCAIQLFAEKIDLKQREDFIKIAANLGNLDGQLEMGDIYNRKKENSYAYKWYYEAFKARHPVARVRLARLYVETQDPSELFSLEKRDVSEVAKELLYSIFAESSRVLPLERFKRVQLAIGEVEEYARGQSHFSKIAKEVLDTYKNKSQEELSLLLQRDFSMIH